MKLFKILTLLFAISTYLVANSDILVFKVDNKDHKLGAKVVEEALKKSGFSVLVNRDMNGPFKKQFQKSSFDIYNLLTTYDKKIAVNLVKKYPDAGIFAPFSMGIWQKKGDEFLHIAIPSAKYMAKVIGHEDKLFKELEDKTIKSLTSAIKGLKEYKLPYNEKSVSQKLITKYETEVDDDEADDNKDEIMMVFENGLKPIGFIKAGSNPLDVDLDEAKVEDFEFYNCLSMCKLKVIYTIAKKHPEAGAFAPCTLVIYHKEGTKKTTLAFPNVYNWFSSLNLSDKEEIDVLKKAQSDIEKLIKSSIE